MAQMGQPAPGQMGFQTAVTPVMEEIHSFHDFVNIIIIAIGVFVLALLLWVIIRYNSRSNPTPSKLFSQYYDRGSVDGRSDPDSGCDWGAVIQAAFHAVHVSEARHHD